MKVLIADDHSIVREGVKQILKTLPEICHIEEVADGNEALSMLHKEKYDLVILDISMPGKSGLDLLQVIRQRNRHTRVLMLSFHPQEQYAVRAFRLGASGYISKDSAFEELAAAITKIAAGEKYISSAFAEKLFFSTSGQGGPSTHDTLSEREFQVMIMLAKGMTVMEIAGEIFISDKTVSTYRSRILEKMGLKKNTDLTFYAIKNNLIE